MPETVATCLLCDNTQSSLFDQREFRGYTVENRQCQNCGLIFQSPRMTRDELDAFYKSEYRWIYQESQEPVSRDLAVQGARAKKITEILFESGVNKIIRHLDIGCSSGQLLEAVHDVYKCQVVGIEPGDAYRDYAEKRGLKVHENLKAVVDEPPFDLISMVHVLEHIPRPVSYLEDIRRNYLSNDGLLLIEVPNLYAHDSFEIAHLVAFSQHSLSQLVAKAGFSIEYLEVHGQPLSNLIPLYITLLAKRGNQSGDNFEIKKEQWVGLKRRSGLIYRRILTRYFPEQAWLPEFRS